jgi:hypothetical protein
VNKKRAEEMRNLVLVISFALFGVFSFYYWGSPTQKIKESIQLNKESSDTDEHLSEALHPARYRSIAESYIRAFQAENCAEITRLTWWMQERLLFLQEQTLDETERTRALEEMCTEVRRDRTAPHLLTVEGIADQYVLTPQSTFDILGADQSTDKLAKPAAERVWVRVSYPNKAVALKDGKTNPIKSLVIGIHISTDEYILKAGIRGNIEIDLERIAYWK